MNADRLLALYDRVAEAPDAVGRMRNFVLDIAVRGKLVEQDPADEPAAELLKRIEMGKQQLVKAKAIRKPKLLPDLDPSQVSFTLPSGWCWARIDDLSPRSLTDGDWIETKDQSEGGVVRLIQLADVGVGAFLDKSARFVTEETEVRLRCTRLTAGDILIARLPNPIGRACIFPDIGQPAITAVDVAILRTDKNLYNKYIEIAINAPPTREQIEAYGKGATRFRVSTGHLKTIVLPLPPIDEQHRIVAKVDELMAVCDQLEEARTVREDTRDRLTKASLARLSAPDEDVPTFRSHARFAVDALPALAARADQVKHLRQTILNLAVRGKLVEQNPADEPASELLKRIEVQRAKAPKAKRRKSYALNAGVVDGDLFDLPNGWEWTPLAGISDVTMGQSPPGDTYNKSGDGVPLINGPVEFTSGPFARTIVDQFTTVPTKFCEEGDLLICVRGSTTGRTNVAAFRACIGRGVAAICSSFDDEFIRIFLWKAREDIISMGRGMAFPSVSKKQLENLAIPLPPLAEQRRIVAEVDELMALCDRLEASLVATDTTRHCLLESLLQDALEPAADQFAAVRRLQS